MAIVKKHVKAIIQLRRAKESEWIEVNPILREGEPALSTDKNKLKIGNGSLHWSEIPYMAGGGGEGGKDYYAGNGLKLNDTIFSIDTAVVAELEDLPTRLSELENDSGYISDFTETDPTVPSWAKAQNKPTYTANEVGALPDDTFIPSKTSDLTNDSGYITRAVNDLTNYYTKSQTYTKDEVNAAIGAITTLDIRVVQALPTEDISTTTIYLVPLSDPQTQNVYDEYIYVSNAWEKIGTTAVDLSNYYTKSEVDNILENNYYNMDTIDDMLEGFAPNNMIETTWANLVELRDNAELVKGAWYRITDYNFVTTKLGVQSGNHQFDIVLLAISESMLSESGYACKHAGDHYFEREVTEGGIEWLYTLYVDDYAESYGDEAVDHSDDIHSTDVFCNHTYDISPVTGDEVPVLFKTDGEEYSIDDPDYNDRFYYEGTYDLDGDEYDMWGKYEYDQDNEEWVFLQQYALTPIVVEDGELIVSPIPETKIVPVNMNAWELKYCLDNDKELFDWATTDGKGVIYYLKDEFGNEAPYDFKNILFQRKNITSVSSNILSVFTQGESSRIGLFSNYAITCGNKDYYYYTFDSPYNAGNDSSLFGDSAYNVIKPYIIYGQRLLNNIVLGFANNNYFGNNCCDITIWDAVRNNNFEYECSDLLIFAAAEVDAKSLRYATMYSISTTKFDSGCRQCIGNTVSGFEVGAGSFQLNFGTSNLNNQIGRGCQNIKFGSFSYNNKFSHGVANLNLGNYVSYCEFGTAAVDITLPNYVRYCKFEPDIHRIEFTTSGGSSSRYIQYVTVCRGISNLTVAPPRNTAYEQIYYKTGRIETAV